MFLSGLNNTPNLWQYTEKVEYYSTPNRIGRFLTTNIWILVTTSRHTILLGMMKYYEIMY